MTITTEFPVPEKSARDNMSTFVFIFAVVSVFITSTSGLLCNSILFYNFIRQKKSMNGFQKICMVKSVLNFLISATFLFWVVPVTMLSYTYSKLNYFVNRFLGLLSASWAYYLNSHMQLCLACNRFYCLYFPFGIESCHSMPMTNIAISISVVTSVIYTVFSVPVGCGYVFDPDLFVWRGEDGECAKKIGTIFPYLVFTMTLTTNLFNLATGARILVNTLSGVSREKAGEMKRRWMMAFAQNVVQDCLQLIDTINSYYIVQLNDSLWFQFVFVTLSMITCTALDGLVMFVFHSACHPSWLKRTRVNGNAVKTVAEKTRIGSSKKPNRARVLFTTFWKFVCQ